MSAINDYKTETFNGKEYVKVCRSEDVVEKKGIKIQFPDDIDMQVAIFRIDGELFCVKNICPHKHQPVLYKGFIKDCTITCPAHGWTYDLNSGENTNKHQGIKSLEKYDIFEKSGYVYIEKPELKIPKWRQ